MPSSREARAALQLLTGRAVDEGAGLLRRFRGPLEVRRAALLETVPNLIGYYSEGSAALAADFYEDERDRVGVEETFTTELVVNDRTVKIRRAIAWSAAPLADEDDILAGKRLAEVIQFETATPFRDTVLENRRRDPAAVGWRRVTNGGCKLCRMLADRGAVYKEDTVHFAAHPNCHCGVQPVFGVNDFGEEAGVAQYLGSRRNRTPAQRAKLREYLDSFY